MDWALLTVDLAGVDLSVEAVARGLRIEPSAVDGDYGLVPIDRDACLYAVRVDTAHMPPKNTAIPYHGPFSDPGTQPA